MLSDIKPGVEIEYCTKMFDHGRLRGKDELKRGLVKQITPRLIAIQGQRYPDTILVNDLLSGQAQIFNITEGEDNLVKPKRESPPHEELERLWEKYGAINPIAKELGASWAYVKRWLIEAGIVNSLGQPKQQQTPLAPGPVGSQEAASFTAEEYLQQSICQAQALVQMILQNEIALVLIKTLVKQGRV